jgi:pyruvate formate lyase activating enzyme
MESNAREARYYRQEGAKIVCEACPRDCTLAEGQHGFCFVRQNVGGKLLSLAYGRPNAVAVDPIEKKPLFHFLPGSKILSLGTAGCNLGCKFCQNWDLSKARSLHGRSMDLPPATVPQLADQEGCASVAFTYNDPTVFVEYAIDAARACHELGIATVAVTAGYIGKQAREDLYAHLDAANIDLKGFTDAFYQRLCLARLDPILETIEYAVKHGVWVELTTLVIPGHNDSDEELAREARWIVEHVGRDAPLHFSAFHPDYKMNDLPRTPASTLSRARQIALTEGLRFVYTGNVADEEGSATCCPECHRRLVTRDWFAVRDNALVGTDKCPGCGARIPGVFDRRSRAASRGERYGLV